MALSVRPGARPSERPFSLAASEAGVESRLPLAVFWKTCNSVLAVGKQPLPF